MSELSERLKKIPELALTSIHMGVDEEEVINKQRFVRDHWRVTISYNGKSYSTEYHTGTGSRKLITQVKKEGNRYYNRIAGQFKTELEACKAQWLKLIDPTLADVMHNLLSDGSCVEGTFEDFCSEFGYDTDSRRALDTYLTCQGTRSALIKMLGTKLFNELSQLEH